MRLARTRSSKSERISQVELDRLHPVLCGTAVDQPWILLQFWTDPPSDRSSRDLGSILWAAIIMKVASEFRTPALRAQQCYLQSLP